MPAGHQAAHLDIVVSLPSSRTLLEEPGFSSPIWVCSAGSRRAR